MEGAQLEFDSRLCDETSTVLFEVTPGDKFVPVEKKKFLSNIFIAINNTRAVVSHVCLGAGKETREALKKRTIKQLMNQPIKRISIHTKL